MSTSKDSMISAARAAATSAQWAEALKLTDAVLADDGTQPVALRLRARALGNLERMDEAQAAWEAVARVSPDLPEAPLNIARLEKRRGNWDAVLPACDRVLQLQPNHPEILKLAASAIERPLKIMPTALTWRCLAQNDISGFFSMVLELDSQGRLVDAANAVAAGCDIRPDDNGLRQERLRLAQDLAERANSLENAGDFARASEHLRTAAHLDKANGELYRSKLARLVKPLVVAGRDALQAKNLEAGVEVFTEALAYDPDNHTALIGLARCREQRDEWALAVPLWLRVTALDPSNQLGWLRLGIGSDRIGDPRLAREAFGRVTDPQYAESVARGQERLAHSAYKAARTHYVAGDFEKAAEALAVASDMQGGNEAVLSLQSRVDRAIKRSQRLAFGQRDYVTAVRLGERVLGTNPEDAEPWVLHARALHALKRSDEALKAWLQADKRAPDRADVFLGIARAAHEIGAFDESRAAVNKALLLSPEDPKCLELLARLDKKAAGAPSGRAQH